MTDLSTVEILTRDGVPIARLRGEIDLSNADRVLRSIEAAVVADAPGIVVDVQGLEYLDSAGVRLLFRASRSIGDAGGIFVAVVTPYSPARRVLELAQADQVFPIEQTEDAALARIAR